MFMKDFLLKSFYENKNLSRDKNLTSIELDKLEEKFLNSLTSEQKDLYEKIYDKILEIHTIEEEMLVDFVWDFVKKMFLF